MGKRISLVNASFVGENCERHKQNIKSGKKRAELLKTRAGSLLGLPKKWFQGAESEETLDKKLSKGVKKCRKI